MPTPLQPETLSSALLDSMRRQPNRMVHGASPGLACKPQPPTCEGLEIRLRWAQHEDPVSIELLSPSSVSCSQPWEIDIRHLAVGQRRIQSHRIFSFRSTGHSAASVFCNYCATCMQRSNCTPSSIVEHENHARHESAHLLGPLPIPQS